ncbi:hypothetical protein COI59_19865 [Bacillus toyonensis]|nr:hypothetical protein COI59_19865 [Bacillus toyonensis]
MNVNSIVSLIKYKFNLCHYNVKALSFGLIYSNHLHMHDNGKEDHKMKKTVTTGLVLITLLTSSIPAIRVLAESKSTIANTQKNSQSSDVVSTIDNQLGIQSVLLQTDALSILQQPSSTIPAIPNLARHVQQAQTHARYWLDSLQVKFLGANQGVISFSQDIESYYDALIDLAQQLDKDPQSKQDFIRGMGYLQASLLELQSSVQHTVQDLDVFKNSLDTDINKFSSDIGTAISTLSQQASTDNSTMMSLVRQIQQKRDFIMASHMQRMEDFIVLVQSADGHTGLGKTYGTIISTVVGTFDVRNAANDIIDLQKKINELASRLSSTEFQITNLNFVEQEMNSFKVNLTKGQQSLEGFNKRWGEWNQDIIDILATVEKETVDSVTIQTKLTQFKKKIAYAEDQARQQEQALTGVKYQ